MGQSAALASPRPAFACANEIDLPPRLPVPAVVGRETRRYGTLSSTTALNVGAAMSGRSRVLAAMAGVVMVVGGLLVLLGYRGGWLLVAAAAAAAVACVVSGSLGAGRRFD
jgi:hypothetical protein